MFLANTGYIIAFGYVVVSILIIITFSAMLLFPLHLSLSGATVSHPHPQSKENSDPTTSAAYRQASLLPTHARFCHSGYSFLSVLFFAHYLLSTFPPSFVHAYVPGHGKRSPSTYAA